MCIVICHLTLLMIALVVQAFFLNFYIAEFTNLFLLWQLGFVLCFKRPSLL